MNLRSLFFAVFFLLSRSYGAPAGNFQSHPPQRPLPVPSQRALPAGEFHVVDTAHGEDGNAGTADAPWRTLEHALAQQTDGGVICLHAGVYHTHGVVHVSATREHPLVIRSWPGELAVLDGGIADFEEHPDVAWEPCTDGVAGEFCSKKTYPLARTIHPGDADGDGTVLAMARFLDSMVPLHGCRFHADLQSDNPWWNITGKGGTTGAVYCGPSVWQDGLTGRIHCRLAPTKLPALGDDNYTGVDDPRRAPLCLATIADGPVLTIDSARHVILQDIVLRGSVTATLVVRNCADIALDGVTIYGGGDGLEVVDTAGLRLTHSACRGMAAPWMYRGALKYRSVEARLFSAGSWMPTGVDNRDFEIAYCEFTDSEDGVFLGGVHGVRFHHNLMEHLNDDGLFLTVLTGYDGQVPGGDMKFWQNRFASCLTTFAFGVGHGRQLTLPDRVQTGDGLWITRNVFDFRRPQHYNWPRSAEDRQEPVFRGRFAGDHGSPAWEPMWVYHNTFVGGQVQRPDFGIPGLGAGMGKGTTRHVLDNILCVDIGKAGTALPRDPSGFTAQGNLLWSFDAAAPSAAAPAGNQIADPGFKNYATDWHKDADLSPKAGIAGAAIPAEWFDPMSSKEIGALSTDAEPWRIGVRGRLDVCGRDATATEPVPDFPWTFPDDHPAQGPHPTALHALSVRGYPAWDAPILEYLLRRRGVVVESHDREPVALTADLLNRQQLVLYDGSLTRAQVEPDTLGESDLAALETWLQKGGTLLLGYKRKDIFRNEAGQAFLARHISAQSDAAPESSATETVRVGEGRIVVLGSSPGSKLTDNRRGSSPEADAVMLDQVRILEKVLDNWVGTQTEKKRHP